jgi:hypothetical protein
MKPVLSNFVSITVCVLFFAISGCGGGPKTTPVPPPSESLMSIKAITNHYIETGEFDSGTVTLQDNVQALKTKNDPKGAELEPLVQKFLESRGHAQIKENGAKILEVVNK